MDWPKAKTDEGEAFSVLPLAVARQSLPLEGKVASATSRMRWKPLLRSPYPLPTPKAPMPLAKSVVVTFCPQKVTKKGR